MTAPSLSAIAAEIARAHEQLTAAEAAGEYDDLDMSSHADIMTLAEQMDTWANALAIVAEVSK